MRRRNSSSYYAEDIFSKGIKGSSSRMVKTRTSQYSWLWPLPLIRTLPKCVLKQTKGQCFDRMSKSYLCAIYRSEMIHIPAFTLRSLSSIRGSKTSKLPKIEDSLLRLVDQLKSGKQFLQSLTWRSKKMATSQGPQYRTSKSPSRHSRRKAYFNSNKASQSYGPSNGPYLLIRVTNRILMH